jgi:putative ABC transport system permease protein
MLSEIRFAARRLLHDRWSTAAAILVTGLGTGLNTAVFVVAYGVLERPLPYREAARLVLVDVPAPFTQLEDWRGRLASFEEIAGYAAEGFTVRGLAEPRFLMVAVVDDRFFETLGSTALTGRTFARHDSGAVAVLSERVARQSGAPIENLPGRTIAIGEMTATIVGVMPAAFEFPSQGTGVWIRGQAVPAIAFDRSPDARRFRLLGRLKPGVTLQQAGEDVRRNGSALDPEFSTTTVGQTLVRSLHEALVGGVRPALLALTAAAGIVLLGACANVATILIGRTIARRRELAVRTALGASRGRLFATIFSESILTAAAGAGLGAILAIGGVRAFASRAAGIVPRLGDVPIDWSMLAIALAVAAVSSILAAAPALRSIEPAGTRLRQDLSQSSSAVRIRAVLGASQIALAVLLLSAAGLLARTIVGLLGEDAGVETRGAMVSQLMLTDAMAFTAAERQRQMQHVLDRVRAMPGAVAAGAGSSLPPENAPIAITARFVSGSEITRTPELSLASVTPGYLEALGVRLLGGRYFEEPDERRGNLVAVLSESAARVLLPGINAVGGQLPIALPGMRDRGRATVLGVVADVKFTGLEAAAGPAVYVLWKELPAGQVYLALRTRADARSAAETLRATLRSAAPDMPVMPIRPLDEVMQRSVAGRSFRAQLAASLGLLAVGIAVLGVGAGLGRVVSERRRELAIRSALGATPGRAVRMILRHGAIITAAGIVVGLLATLAAGNLLRAFLFGISPHDPATLSVVVLIVATGSLSACYVPARSAAATNPLDMLREE